MTATRYNGRRDCVCGGSIRVSSTEVRTVAAVEAMFDQVHTGAGHAPAASAGAPGRPGLTRVQSAIVAAIADWTRALGYPPTYRELGAAAGLSSTSAVVHQLRALEAKGYLRLGEGRARALQLVDAPEAAS